MVGEPSDGQFATNSAGCYRPCQTVLRRGDELTIVNSVRLSDEGEGQLTAMGAVRHLVPVSRHHDDLFRAIASIDFAIATTGFEAMATAFAGS